MQLIQFTAPLLSSGSGEPDTLFHCLNHEIGSPESQLFLLKNAFQSSCLIDINPMCDEELIFIVDFIYFTFFGTESNLGTQQETEFYYKNAPVAPISQKFQGFGSYKPGTMGKAHMFLPINHGISTKYMIREDKKVVGFDV